MQNKTFLIAVIRFFAGFCVNIAAGFFIAIFVSQNIAELTERTMACILSSYMTIALEELVQSL